MLVFPFFNFFQVNIHEIPRVIPVPADSVLLYALPEAGHGSKYGPLLPEGNKDELLKEMNY
jgi:hypothetical protein